MFYQEILPLGTIINKKKNQIYWIIDIFGLWYESNISCCSINMKKKIIYL